MTFDKTLFIGTTNAGKVAEFVSLLSPLGLKVQVVTGAEEVVEPSVELTDGFLENARVKALHYARLSGGVTLAEDSGLSVAEHRYFGMSGTPIRPSHPFFKNVTFKDDDGYPTPMVRFDWRNPITHPGTGARLCDEVLGDEMADWFIDVNQARLTAKQVFKALSDFLAPRDVVIYDLCLFITEDGRTVFGEISQDCGRFRHFDLGSLDKDVWRAGGSSDQVLEKWKTLLEVISR